MTGFDSKRQAAKAKLDDDDDTQVYADMLLIVYQRGFADGKKAQRKPLTDEEIQAIWDVAAGAIPGWSRHIAYARAIEAAHGIKEKP
jgi:hypothetical protein